MDISKIKIKVKETDEDFVKIILYHELGYYLEYRRNRELGFHLW